MTWARSKVACTSLVQVLAPEADLIRPIKGVLEISPLPKGEAVLESLRSALGSLPIAPLRFENPLDGVLTGWLAGDPLPKGFSLAGRAALRSQEAPLPIDKDPGAARPNQGLREQFAGQRFNSSRQMPLTGIPFASCAAAAPVTP